MEGSLIAVNAVVIIVLLIGAGLTMTGLPGNLLIVLTVLAYSLYEGFNVFDSWLLLIICALFVFGEIIEFLAGAIGAKREKASSRTVIAAFLGTIIGGILGSVVLPFIGSLLGALAGGFFASYIAEYTKTGDLEKAKRIAQGVLKSQIIGIAVKFAVAVAMIIMVVNRLFWH